VLVIDKENKQNESKKEAEQNENKNNDDGSRIVTEVATFRSDGAYSDGRRPDAVRFSTDPREDAVRRDFSINGMLLDVLRYDAATVWWIACWTMLAASAISTPESCGRSAIRTCARGRQAAHASRRAFRGAV